MTDGFCVLMSLLGFRRINIDSFIRFGSVSAQFCRWFEVVKWLACWPAKRKVRGRGVHPPEAMMHFPLFQISPIFPILPFPKKIFDFHPPRFPMTYIYSLFQHISPYFGKIIIFPLLLQISPIDLRASYILYVFFV